MRQLTAAIFAIITPAVMMVMNPDPQEPAPQSGNDWPAIIDETPAKSTGPVSPLAEDTSNANDQSAADAAKEAADDGRIVSPYATPQDDAKATEIVIKPETVATPKADPITSEPASDELPMSRNSDISRSDANHNVLSSRVDGVEETMQRIEASLQRIESNQSKQATKSDIQTLNQSLGDKLDKLHTITVEYQTKGGAVRSVAATVAPSGSGSVELQPGERVVSIGGQEIEPYASSGPVSPYASTGPVSPYASSGNGSNGGSVAMQSAPRQSMYFSGPVSPYASSGNGCNGGRVSPPAPPADDGRIVSPFSSTYSSQPEVFSSEPQSFSSPNVYESPSGGEVEVYSYESPTFSAQETISPESNDFSFQLNTDSQCYTDESGNTVCPMSSAVSEPSPEPRRQVFQSSNADRFRLLNSSRKAFSTGSRIGGLFRRDK